MKIQAITLKKLEPGTTFRYTQYHRRNNFCRGTFRVLAYTSYLETQSGSTWVLNLDTSKVCCHSSTRYVKIIKEKEEEDKTIGFRITDIEFNQLFRTDEDQLLRKIHPSKFLNMAHRFAPAMDVETGMICAISIFDIITPVESKLEVRG